MLWSLKIYLFLKKINKKVSKTNILRIKKESRSKTAYFL